MSEQQPNTTSPLTLTCHCGLVRLTVPRRPRQVNECNCSICYRYGVQWGYYLRTDVAVSTTAADAGTGGEEECYVRTDDEADGQLGFFRCRRCGVVTHWDSMADSPRRKGPGARLGVNWRLAGVHGLAGVERIVTHVSLPSRSGPPCVAV